MDVFDLHNLLQNGESLLVEFKRDSARPEDIAKEMSALLNTKGGKILLGVEDDGSISGLTRPVFDAEQWVTNIAQNNIRPSCEIEWQTLRLDSGKVVGIIELASFAQDKPYKAKLGSSWSTYVRSGSTSRLATREQEGRLYQSAKILRYDIKPVLDTNLESLDLARIENYFKVILQRDVPDREDIDEWIRILCNLDYLAETKEDIFATVAGLLLFGRNPNRRLPQAGITATAFPGEEKDYAWTDDEIIRGPLVPIISPDTGMIETGVIDRAVQFVNRNVGSQAWLEGAMRVSRSSLPEQAVREAVVNAIVHRDYTFEGVDIEISLYIDRLEIISPGSLPNGATVEKIKEGIRVTRNDLLKDTLRDYNYIDHRGMGIRNKVMASMKEHNGTEPDLIEEEDRFIVRLWK